MSTNSRSISQAKVIVGFGDSGKKITTTVDRVSAAVGEGQTGRALFASLDADKVANVRPGDFVTITIEEPVLKNVAILPSTAASAIGEVLVLGANDRLEVAQVEILRKQADKIIITLGSLSGREVVLERAPQLGAGIKVNPRRIDVALESLLDATETVQISDEMRQKMIAYVRSNKKIPIDQKQKIIHKLNKPQIPRETYDRITARMGG